MVADQDLVILVVEDEETVRQQIVQWMESLGYRTFLQAEHMEQAREILRDHWDEIGLIVMDVMLPRDESDARRIRDLVAQRESAYSEWLALEAEGRLDDDPDWLRARFAIDSYDRQIFGLLDVAGGIHLMEECVNRYGGRRLQKLALYLTARENRKLRDQGIDLIAEDEAYWLVKPVTAQEVLPAVRQLLAQEQ